MKNQVLNFCYVASKSLLGTHVLALLVTILVGSALSECLDGNCTEQQSAQFPDIASIFQMFGPVDVNNERNNFNAAVDPILPTTNITESSEPREGGIISFNFMEVMSLNGEQDSADDQESAGSDESSPDIFSIIFRQSSFMNVIGILDLSGRNLTGDQVANEIKTIHVMGQPITSLILSNSRIQGLTVNSFQLIEDSLQELRMDNCSVNLDAIVNLSNLRSLNLSNTGLSTFQWYPKLQDSLQVLDLSHNLFAEVRPELSVLTSLKELDLSYNRITSVKEFPLVLLPNLEVLSLTMNSLTDATFTGIFSLKRLEVDWNYLWRSGQELQLPSQSLQIKLASNPWRCDCGLLEARDHHDVLDMDILQCADRTSFAVCDGCQRYFLPLENGLNVSNLTLESVDYLGCTGLVEQLWWLQGEVAHMRPESQLGLALLFCGCLLMLVSALAMCKQSCNKKKLNRQSWISQQIPYLKIDKLTKPKEVPYIKI